MAVSISDVKVLLQQRQKVCLVSQTFMMNGTPVSWSRPKFIMVTGVIDNEHFDGRMLLGGDRVTIPASTCRTLTAVEISSVVDGGRILV